MHDFPIVLFDLDGTLIDSTPAIVESFETAFHCCGSLCPPADEVTALIGHPLLVMFARLGVHQGRLEEHVAAYKTHYRTVATAKTSLLPFAREAVEEAAGFARLGVVTTKTGSYSRVILEHLGIMDYFEVLVGYEDVVNVKPHPEPVLTALQRIGGVASERVFMVGDTSMDVQSALGACVTPLAVTSGYEAEEQLRCHAAHIFDHALDACRFARRKVLSGG
ncbi:HAD-IA family hydrolase [Desulfurispirillum indicum]|uniref:HAD family hydrolase n=1 Tax=Desulfurispirillum indicum TaxID=936456 RepID=UPI001CF99381|nr:HAD-IA family hydrolase [Desulfurispirillum indicum]UCZ57533.1 HAD-IA family hydrolase [Desulfurispirillum indicum]